MISGSGPTVVFLCAAASRPSRRRRDGGAGHEVVLVANGPVAGAHLVEYA